MDADSIQRIMREAREKALLLKRIRLECGDKALQAAQSFVIDRTRAQLVENDLPKRDLNTAMEILWDEIDGLAEFTEKVRRENKLVLNVTRCLFAEEMATLGAQDEGYALFCSYDDGFCQGLNPRIKFSRNKTLMEGFECCNHSYELDG